MRLPAVIALALLGALPPACSAPGDPSRVLASTRQTDSARLEAISAVAAHPTEDAHASLSRALWDRSSRARVRIAAFHALASLPGGEPQARRACAALLPSEPDPSVVEALAAAAAAHSWSDASASLLRSLARPWRGVPDSSRPEAIALASLNPNRDLVSLAWGAAVSDAPSPDTYPGVDRATIDAWNLLARIDPTGDQRRRRLGGDRSPVPEILRAWASCLPELPATGEELAWMVRLDSTSHAAWKRQAWEVLKCGVPGSRAPQLRHAEPLRWVAAHRALWLDLSPGELLAGLEQSLSVRRHSFRRSGLGSVRYSESLEAAAPRLSRHDRLTILALDDALRSPAVAADLFRQASLDRADPSTEYGGLLIASRFAGAQDDLPVARLFPPRPGERLGDERFVASDDMLASADLALAHYHFHAQGGALAQACGPSAGDLDYARRFGVNCIVLTALDDGRLGVDYYQPDGTVLDLGDLTPPPVPAAARTPPRPRRGRSAPSSPARAPRACGRTCRPRAGAG